MYTVVTDHLLGYLLKRVGMAQRKMKQETVCDSILSMLKFVIIIIIMYTLVMALLW